MKISNRKVSTLLISVATAAISLVAPATAAAQTAGERASAWSPAEPPVEEFYRAPATLPDKPGEVIRSEGVAHLLNLGIPNLPGYAQRIMYTSTTQDGRIVATSGAVFEPETRWVGEGPAPTVVMPPGTRGQGDQCAPSKGGLLLGNITLDHGPTMTLNYEIQTVEAALMQGMRVVVPDYIGLGTQGVHTYVNRLEEGHATLDAARAALALAHQPADFPVGILGYSQGGGASAAAAELASDYSPDLNIKGAFIGAPPADLLATVHQLNGGLASALIGYALNSFATTDRGFAEGLKDILKPEGLALMDKLSRGCVVDSTAFNAFIRWENFTKSGESLEEETKADPRLKSVLDKNALGNHPISMPVQVFGNPNDDMLPAYQVRTMSKSYCEQGGTVDHVVDSQLPIVPKLKLGANHAVSLMTGEASGLAYLTDRFNNVPAPNNCASL